jgi:hypothetical protein
MGFGLWTSSRALVPPYNLADFQKSVSLAAGVRLGAYEILSLLDAGGMGEV